MTKAEICPNCGQPPDHGIELGEEVHFRVRKPVGSLIAVRMPHDLATRLFEYARGHEDTVSAVIREAVDRFLDPLPTSFTVAVSSAKTITIDSRDVA